MTEIYLKQILPLTFISTLSILIWQVGPYLTLGAIHPLLLPQHRFYVIALLFLSWLVKFLFFDTAPTTPLHFTTEDLKKIETLSGRFQGAINFLKKTFISKQGKKISLSQLPWYFLIGTANSGKTTLLANSNINFILSKQFKSQDLKSISASQHCDWWMTRDLVMVDVPSAYLNTSKLSQKNSILWQHLLDLVKKTKKTENLAGIVVALQLPELMKKNNSAQRKQTLTEIKLRITQLREQFGKELPVYLTLTKCDLIPGFAEFFSDSGNEELSQAWGITFPPLKDNEKLHEVCVHRFNALIKRLNTQIIWRLHQERHPQARALIKDFPLHLERLKESLANFLKALMMPGLCLQGIYLTSALQATDEEHISSPLLNQHATAHHALQLSQLPANPSRSYFIRQLLLQALATTQSSPHPRFSAKKLFENRKFYIAGIAIIIAATVFLGRDFQISLQQENALQTALTQYQSIERLHPQFHYLSKALPILNDLNKAVTPSHPPTFMSKIFSYYSDKSQKTSQSIYHQALLTIVIPEVKTLLEKNLRAVSEKNPGQLYMALKAYLMLDDNEHIDTKFVTDTINELIANSLTAQDIKLFDDQMLAALSSNWQGTHLDETLITHARKQLTNLSAIDMGFAILKNLNNNNAYTQLQLGTSAGSQPVFVSKQLLAQVPTMYTATSFQQIISNDIANAASETLQGNWVLGTTVNAETTPGTDILIEQLRALYISKYTDVWESLLANIQLNTPKNITELYSMLAQLSGKNSPLLELLNTIQKNTHFAPIMAASPKLNTLNSLILTANRSEQNTLSQSFLALKQLDFYFQTIMHSPNTGNAAVDALKNHTQLATNDPIFQLGVIAEQNPEPLKSWLINLHSVSSKLLLQESLQFIAKSWNGNIGAIYQTQFANHYPFNQNATTEISLQQFAAFLGQQGTLSHFYQTFLKPFVNESQKKWQWRTIDNMRIPFSDIALQKIQKALKIQRAFFPNGDNQLFVQFSLEPLSVDASIKDFALNINGQEISFQNQHNPRTLSWPGANTAHKTTVQAIANDNQKLNNSFQGDWGWFRLITQSTHEVSSPKELKLNIALDGHIAKYVLHTQSTQNPFLPITLTQFELPDKLI